MTIQALPSIRATLTRLVNAALERLADGDRGVVDGAADAERVEAGGDPAVGGMWMERTDFLALARAISRG